VSSEKSITPVPLVQSHPVDAASGPQGKAWGGPLAAMSAVALQSWDDGDHKSMEMESLEYGSPLLACEAKLRELQYMASGVEQPNPMTVSIALDLLQKVVQTMPIKMRQTILPLMAPLSQAIFSGSLSEPASSSVANGKNTMNSSFSPVLRSDSRVHPVASTSSLKLNAEETTGVPRAKRDKRTTYFVLARQQHSTMQQKKQGSGYSQYSSRWTVSCSG
jgi:hypothetical protein